MRFDKFEISDGKLYVHERREVSVDDEAISAVTECFRYLDPHKGNVWELPDGSRRFSRESAELYFRLRLKQ